MENVRNITDYIVLYCNKKHYNLTTVRLQNLLYFLNVIYILKSKNKKALFKTGAFEMWEHGARNQKMFEDYSVFNGNQITHPVKHLANVSVNKYGLAIGHYITYKDENFKSFKPFVDKYLPVLLKIPTDNLVIHARQEYQWKHRVGNGQLYNNNETYKFYKNKKHQFWIKKKSKSFLARIL